MDATCLVVASMKGHVAVAKVLLDCGADANLSADVQSPTLFALVTPLHFACYRGDVDMVRLLLEHQADVTALDDQNRTPLHMASTTGCLPVV